MTGASGYVGSRLIERLEAEREIERILAIDLRPPPRPSGPKVVFLKHDVSTPFASAFSHEQIDTVVHLAFVLRPGSNRTATQRVNIDDTRNMLDACAESGVRRVVYLSSTTVYGAHSDNPPMLTESVSPRPVKGFQYGEDKAAAEALIHEFVSGRPDATSAVLRYCPVVGPNADNFIARAFLKPFLVGFRGYDPPMQLTHEDDLTDILALCTLRDISGLYNVAGDGTIDWSDMARTLGKKLVSLPAPILRTVTDLAWALRLQSDSPSSGLNFVRYPWTAGTDKIKRELGVEFRYSSREAWESFARGQRHGRV